MVTKEHPALTFAPLEVVERLLEIKAEQGYCEVLWIISTDDLALSFDAFGLGVFSTRKSCGRVRFTDRSVAVLPFSIESEREIVWN